MSNETTETNTDYRREQLESKISNPSPGGITIHLDNWEAFTIFNVSKQIVKDTKRMLADAKKPITGGANEAGRKLAEIIGTCIAADDLMTKFMIACEKILDAQEAAKPSEEEE